jgi:predicted PurR-regulated permease PerM
MAAPSSQARLNRWVALLGVTAVTVYLSWKVLEPFIEVLILGVALTVIFQPVHRRFVGWTRGHRIASALSTLAVLLVLIVPFTFVSITMVNELPHAIDAVKGGIRSWQKAWDDSAAGSGWLASLREQWQVDQFLTPEKLDTWSTDVKDFVLVKAFPVVTGVVGFIVSFVFLIFVLFFLFRDGEKLGTRLINALPMPRDQALALVKRTEEVLEGCVFGVIMVAAIQGTLGGITFWALGLGSPVTWGLVMTLLCTLPIVGAWVVWVPAAVGLAISGDYTRAIILTLIGQFVISSIDGFLRPILVGQRAKMHELVIFFSVLGGLKYFGLLGILLGPIVMSLAWSLLSALWEAQQGGKPGESAPAIPSA